MDVFLAQRARQFCQDASNGTSLEAKITFRTRVLGDFPLPDVLALIVQEYFLGDLVVETTLDPNSRAMYSAALDVKITRPIMTYKFWYRWTNSDNVEDYYFFVDEIPSLPRTKRWGGSENTSLCLCDNITRMDDKSLDILIRDAQSQSSLSLADIQEIYLEFRDFRDLAIEISRCFRRHM